MKLRSKVVEIEAELWDGSIKTLDTIYDFAGDSKVWFNEEVWELAIWNDLEKQWINCPTGHYILKGLKGEFYPCEPEVLFMKYEVIDD